MQNMGLVVVLTLLVYLLVTGSHDKMRDKEVMSAKRLPRILWLYAHNKWEG